MINYVTIKKFALETGYTETAIRQKISNGIWKKDEEWMLAPDNRQLISLSGYHKWVEQSMTESPSRANRQSKSSFNMTVKEDASVLKSSPRNKTLNVQEYFGPTS